MIDVPVATDPEAISPEWLTRVFHSSSALAKDISVKSFTHGPIGTGQLSGSFRLALELSEQTDGLKSCVIKLPSGEEEVRTSVSGVYGTEVSFYQTYAPKLPIRTPFCHFAGMEKDTPWFALVLEDMAPAKQGDQMKGCSVEQAEIAIREITKLHAPLMNEPVLKELPWLKANASHTPEIRPMLPEFYKVFRERYDGLIAPELLSLGQRYYDGIMSLAEPNHDPFTIAHTDYRLDNMLFGTDEGGPPVTVVDWQTTTCDSPLGDIAYFIGAGLLVENRRTHEEDLVRLYHDTMLAAGVNELPWDKCWELYRLRSFDGMTVAVISATVAKRTDRGDVLFQTMFERHAQQALDLDAEKLLVSS